MQQYENLHKKYRRQILCDSHEIWAPINHIDCPQTGTEKRSINSSANFLLSNRRYNEGILVGSVEYSWVAYVIAPYDLAAFASSQLITARLVFQDFYNHY